MKIFITGATGFIGTQLVRRLAGTGHELHCLVRRTSDVRELRGLGAVEVIGDVTDERSLLRGMTGCQWVINLAGVYSYWEPNKRIYADVNINGTRNVMKCALEAGVSKVAHVSTGHGLWQANGMSVQRREPGESGPLQRVRPDQI